MPSAGPQQVPTRQKQRADQLPATALGSATRRNSGRTRGNGFFPALDGQSAYAFWTKLREAAPAILLFAVFTAAACDMLLHRSAEPDWVARSVALYEGRWPVKERVAQGSCLLPGQPRRRREQLLRRAQLGHARSQLTNGHIPRFPQESFRFGFLGEQRAADLVAAAARRRMLARATLSSSAVGIPASTGSGHRHCNRNSASRNCNNHSSKTSGRGILSILGSCRPRVKHCALAPLHLALRPPSPDCVIPPVALRLLIPLFLSSHLAKCHFVAQPSLPICAAPSPGLHHRISRLPFHDEADTFGFAQVADPKLLCLPLLLLP